MRRRRLAAPSALGLATSAQYWYSVEDLARRYGRSPKTIWRVLEPFRGRCHKARRGRHPRLTWWIPKDVVATIDRRVLPAGRADPADLDTTA